MQALWNGNVLAESDATVVVDGNHYFPADSLRKEHFREARLTTVCGWKGTANYYDIVVGEATNEAAAWYYAAPKEAAQEIAGHVAFWKGVEVTGTPPEGGSEITGGACSV